MSTKVVIRMQIQQKGKVEEIMIKMRGRAAMMRGEEEEEEKTAVTHLYRHERDTCGNRDARGPSHR